MTIAFIESKEKIASLTRQLEQKTHEVERLTLSRDAANRKLEEYREKNASLRTELDKSRHDNRASDDGRVSSWDLCMC